MTPLSAYRVVLKKSQSLVHTDLPPNKSEPVGVELALRQTQHLIAYLKSQCSQHQALSVCLLACLGELMQTPWLPCAAEFFAAISMLFTCSTKIVPSNYTIFCLRTCCNS